MNVFFKYMLLFTLFSGIFSAAAIYFPDNYSANCSDTIEFRDMNRIFDHLQRRLYSRFNTIEGCDFSDIFSIDSIQTPTNPLVAHIRDRFQLSQFITLIKSEISKRIAEIKAKIENLTILPLARLTLRNFTKIFQNNMLESLSSYIRMINNEFSETSLFYLVPSGHKEVEDLLIEFFELSKQFPSVEIEDQQQKVLDLISQVFLSYEPSRSATFPEKVRARLDSDSD